MGVLRELFARPIRDDGLDGDVLLPDAALRFELSIASPKVREAFFEVMKMIYGSELVGCPISRELFE